MISDTIHFHIAFIISRCGYTVPSVQCQHAHTFRRIQRICHCDLPGSALRLASVSQDAAAHGNHGTTYLRMHFQCLKDLIQRHTFSHSSQIQLHFCGNTHRIPVRLLFQLNFLPACGGKSLRDLFLPRQFIIPGISGSRPGINVPQTAEPADTDIKGPGTLL